MAKTYAQLNREIEALRAKAESVRKQEVAGVIDRIRKAIDAYQLSAADLGFRAESGSRANGTAASNAPKRRGPGKKAKSAIRYRDDAGHAWTGMGPKPGWLKDAIAAGRPIESFAVAVDAPVRVAGSGKAPKSRKAKKSKAVVRFKDDAGHTWSGRGPMPGWLKQAIADGTPLEKLAA